MAFGSLRRAYRRYQQWRLDPSLAPPTAQEAAEVERLRTEFRAFDVIRPDSDAASLSEWQMNLNALRHDVLAGDPRRFTRFPVVLKTMFVDQADYLPVELDYLRRHREFEARWRPALREAGAGHPPRWRDHPESSGNLIHHCYHLARFGDETGLGPDWPDLVLEFGGGYGSLCRALRSSGFRGRCLIFDFPHFNALQRYFLRSTGATVHEDAAAFRASREGVLCVSSLEELDAALPDDAQRALFIATWSLSEAPAALRAQFLPRVRGMQAFLIGFQDRFNEMDNQAWFGEDWARAVPHAQWRKLPIAHLPGNTYLFGTP